MGCERGAEGEALSDYLLALRALLDATSDAGQASLGLRLAALCAEEGMRDEVQGRLEAAIAFERVVMGRPGGLPPDAESPVELVWEVEGHVRALLRDVLCGYLDADLKAVADDILVESDADPHMEIAARDLRKEPRFEREPELPVTFEPELEYDYDGEPDTAEMEVVTVAPEPLQHELDGVTESVDFGWDDPEDFSAPV
jgi:hypothetical protein